MQIAIIGAGNVGRAIGSGWLTAGHDVHYGVPDPNNAKYANLDRPRIHTVAAAAARAEVVVLATPWPATEAACRELGDVSGKIVIDCTNPLGAGAAGLQLTVGFSTSGAELVQSWLKDARVFKTLNQTGFETMGNAARQTVRPVMFVAGDDPAGKQTVLTLVGDLGFEAIDAGPLTNARLLEPYAMLWIDLAFKRGQGRDFAFALSRPGK